MIRVGVIGFGMAARVFHCPIISSVEGFELAAVMERSTNKAAERYPGITIHRTLEAMLADTSLDLFVVATPSGTHFEVAKQILEAGKNLVVDKPVATSATQIAQLIDLARKKNLLLVPFHNRRWDGDFLTIQKLLREGSLGRLVHFEVRFDRWRPIPPTDRLWKEDAALGGGVLLDLGTHLADQALTLFGKPEAVSADLATERAWATVNDCFSVRLRYPGFTAVLASNSLSTPSGPRYHLRGDKGNYWKYGLDPQEAALALVTRISDPNWGAEKPTEWGVLHAYQEGSIVSEPIATIPGDYRKYYAGVRDALLTKTPPPVTAQDAWSVVQLLEWAAQSNKERREIPCIWPKE